MPARASPEAIIRAAVSWTQPRKATRKVRCDSGTVPQL